MAVQNPMVIRLLTSHQNQLPIIIAKVRERLGAGGYGLRLCKGFPCVDEPNMKYLGACVLGNVIIRLLNMNIRPGINSFSFSITLTTFDKSTSSTVRTSVVELGIQIPPLFLFHQCNTCAKINVHQYKDERELQVGYFQRNYLNCLNGNC